jgi:hypothetical protein
MEVTEVILAMVSRFLSAVFDKTAFEKFKIGVITLNKTLMKHIQNKQKSIGKSISVPAYGTESLKKKIANQKSIAKCL